MTVLVPPIKIQGIKTKLVPLIQDVAEYDKDAFWIEPFAGSCVVGLNISPKHAIFADTNPHTITFFKAIKDNDITPWMAKSFLEKEGEKLQKEGQEYYNEVRDRFNQKHDPLDFLFLNRSCFNGMIRFNRKGGFNVPYGHKPERFAKAYITKITNQISNFQKRAQANDWSFIVQSFEQTIASAPENAFIYCDPPYIGRHVDYFDSWNETQETLLHDLLMAHHGHFCLSTWDHTKYRKNTYLETLWSDCTKTTKEHFYFVGGHESNRNSVTEALLTNYRPTCLDKPRAEEGIQHTLF